MRKNIAATPKAAPIIFQVAFHPDNPSFSPPVLTDGAGGTDPPAGAGAGAAIAAHIITYAAALENFRLTTIGIRKNNSNRARPMGGPDITPRPNANPNSDATLAAISDKINGESNYVKLH